MATIMVHPTAEGVRANIGMGYVALSVPDGGGITSIFVSTRPVLDALTRALAEIRVAMDAQDARDQVASPECDWPPGELAEVFGK